MVEVIDGIEYPDQHEFNKTVLNEVADRLKAVSGSLGIGAHVSVGSSTAVPLASGAEFTGEWETNDNAHIAFNVITDQPGTLYLEFSPDGGTTITLSKPYAVFGGQSSFDALVKGSRSHRVRYVNGSTAQGSFVLSTFTGDNLYPFAKSDRDEPIYFAQSVKNITATEYRVIVDLSDNVAYPHYDVGRLDIYASYLQVDRDGTGAGAVRFGVITRIDGTSADIAYVQGVSFEKSADRRIVRDRDFATPIKLGQSGGDLTKAVTGVLATNVTEVNTATPLPAPLGTVTPAVGDLVAQYERTAGSYDASIAGFYAANISQT